MACATLDNEEQSHVSDIQTQLSKLFDAHSCSICHHVLNAPVSLPCRHLFCSECVRRHLMNHSVCPHPYCLQTATATALTPQRLLDNALAPIRAAAYSALASAISPRLQQRHAQKLKQDGVSSQYLVCLSHRDPGAKPKLIEKLRQNDLPATGNVRVLAARYREFVLKWNASLDANVPQSKQAVAELVMKEERVRDINNIGPSRFSSSSTARSNGSTPKSFFRKARAATSGPRSCSQGNNADADIDADADEDLDDVVEEGDNFDTLIRKTRLRDLKRKRAQEREREAMEKSKALGASLSPISKRPRSNSSSTVVVGGPNSSSQPNGLTVASAVRGIDIRPTVSPATLSFKGVGQVGSTLPSCVNKRTATDPFRRRVIASNFCSTPATSQMHATSTTTFPQQLAPIVDHSFPTSQARLLPQLPSQTPEPTSSRAPVISDEMRQRIAENRRIALDRKRRYNQRMLMQEQELQRQQQHCPQGWHPGGSQMYPNGS